MQEQDQPLEVRQAAAKDSVIQKLFEVRKGDNLNLKTESALNTNGECVKQIRGLKPGEKVVFNTLNNNEKPSVLPNGESTVDANNLSRIITEAGQGFFEARSVETEAGSGVFMIEIVFFAKPEEDSAVEDHSMKQEIIKEKPEDIEKLNRMPNLTINFGSLINDGDLIAMGRASNFHIHSGNNNVSRSHAVAEYKGGKVFIRDSGSTNGTFVNGRRITTESTPLNHFDTVTLGGEDGESLIFYAGRRGGGSFEVNQAFYS